MRLASRSCKCECTTEYMGSIPLVVMVQSVISHKLLERNQLFLRLENIDSLFTQCCSPFQDYDSSEKFRVKDDLVSHLLPTSYQDRIVRVYSKKPHLVRKETIIICTYICSFSLCSSCQTSPWNIIQVEAVSEAFENFQLKTYGMKTQVHATPEKKMRKQLRSNYADV